MTKKPVTLNSVLDFSWKLIKYVFSVFLQLLGAFMSGFFEGAEKEARNLAKRSSMDDPFYRHEVYNAHLKNNGK